MIALLDGTVARKWDHQIILSVQGIGYLVNVGNDLMSRIQENEKLTVFIHTRVKEDDISLFGFCEESELSFFQQLISVSGIGAKTAMAILDSPLSLTHRAIAEEDVSYLSKIPGLGKKTAGRMILELKGKIDLIAPSVENHFPHSLQEEALEALVSLGYDKPSVIRFLNSAPESFESAEDAVRSFLQNA